MWRRLAPIIGVALFCSSIVVLARELQQIGFAQLTAALDWSLGPLLRTGRPDATATLLDGDGTRRVQEAIGRKYGWIGRTLVNRSARRGGPHASIGIRIQLTPASA